MMRLLAKKKIYENDSDNNSFVSNESSEANRLERIHNHYLNKDIDIDTMLDMSVKVTNDHVTSLTPVTSHKIENETTEIYKKEPVKYKGSDMSLSNSSNDLVCNLCKNKSSKDNYVILSCDHIYHIQCLADIHFQDIYNYHVIDNEYFSHRKCNVCSKKMQLEEIMYLHGKYLSNTKDSIEKHQVSIDNLEYQLKKIKDELRICYEYKHKLEQQREKSKQIVSILSTMMYN